jgi:hypothetical protein
METKKRSVRECLALAYQPVRDPHYGWRRRPYVLSKWFDVVVVGLCVVLAALACLP